jgi:hypothetical protein
MKIRDLFYSDPTCALHIILDLSHRADVDQYPNLNLDVLLKWLSEVNEAGYQDIISAALNMEVDYNLSYVNYLSHLILTAFQEKRVSDQIAPKLIQLLCYFSGIKDLKYPRYRENGFGQFPARDAILMVERIINGNLVLEQVQLVHRSCRVVPVTENLQRILHELGER